MVTLCPYLYILHQIVEDRRARKDRGLLPSLRGHSWLSFVSRVVRNGLHPAVFEGLRVATRTRRCGPHCVRSLRRIEGMACARRAISSPTIHPHAAHLVWDTISCRRHCRAGTGGERGAPTREPATGGRRPKNRAAAGADPRTGQQRAPTQEPAVPVRGGRRAEAFVPPPVR